MVSAPMYCRRFIGRQEHLAVLVERGRATKRGETSIIIMSGDAGVGKTRLIDQARAALEKEGVTSAIGASFEYAQAPYAPVADALRSLAQNLSAEAGYVSEIIRGAASEGTGSAAEDKLRRFAEVVDFIRRCAARMPVALVIEDIHWADEGTLELLQHIAAATKRLRLLLILSYRSDEIHRRHPLRAALARFERSVNVWRIHVEPFSEAETAAFIAHALEGHEERVSPPTRNTIRRLSEGNPLFAEELLKNAADDPGSSGRGMQLPLSISSAVALRLGALNEDERRALSIAAVIGRRFTTAMVANILRTDPARTVALMKRAVEAQLVREEPGEEIRFVFRHALTREAILEEMLASERRALHLEVAREIEAVGVPGDQNLAELADHFWEARDCEKAARFNEAAGDAAVNVLAFEVAAECYERALEARNPSSSAAAALHEKLAIALFNAGAIRKARPAYQAAIAAFEREGDYPRASALSLDYGRACYDFGDSPAGLAATERGLELATRSQDRTMSAAARISMAGIFAMTDRYDEAARMLDKAESIGAQLRIDDDRRLHEYRAEIARDAGRIDEASTHYRQAISIASRNGAVATVIRVLGNFGNALTDEGRATEALAVLRGGLDMADEARLRGTAYVTLVLQYATDALLLGALGTARAVIERALAASLDSPRYALHCALTGTRIGVLLEDDDLIARCSRRELVESVFTTYPAMAAAVSLAFSMHLVRQQDRPGARHLLRRCLDTMRPRVGIVDDPWLYLQLSAIGTHADAKRASEELRAIQPVEPRPMYEGFVAMVDGWLARREARHLDAKASGSSAAEIFARLRWPWHQGQALELADRRSEALDVYRAMGDNYDTRRLEAELTPVNRRGRAKTTLTGREKEVARLIAGGLSNRAIAEELVITERTVESHVGSILEKLGAKARVDVALMWRSEQERTSTD